MSAYVLTTNARTSVVLKKGAQNPSCCDSYVFCPGREVQASLHSRRQHHRVGVIHENPEMFDWVKRAWAVWVLANGSYGGKVDGSFGYDRTGSVSKKLANKRASFAEGCAIRLQRAQIESCDALRIIGSRDAQDAFFYLDPPYVGTDQGHYDGYAQEDFDAFLRKLEGVRGKFLLSSYRNASLPGFSWRNGWHTVEIRLKSAMGNGPGRTPRAKIEVLTANYPISLEGKPAR